MEFIVNVQFVTEVFSRKEIYEENGKMHVARLENWWRYFWALKNSAVKKIQNYGNKWIQHFWQMDRLPHLNIFCHNINPNSRVHLLDIPNLLIVFILIDMICYTLQTCMALTPCICSELSVWQIFECEFPWISYWCS